MRVLVIPDSFKGSLTAHEASSIIAEAFRQAGARVHAVPIADGGEGTVDCMLAAVGGQLIEDTVIGPLGTEVTALRGVLCDGTAIVELAQAAGLGLVGNNLCVGTATTYGVGQQIRAAAHDEPEELIVGIGGSATNDGGCGLAAACGIRFYDSSGKSFVPVGSTLQNIAAIDADGLDEMVADTEIVAMCDVDTALTGPAGAAAIFAPQKGADAALVRLLDDGLRHLEGVIQRDLGISVDIPGAGAAGGAGAGLAAFLGAKLVKGVELILDRVRVEELIKEVDCIVTGEGSLDEHSLRGKVISGVLRRARPFSVPVHVLAGRVSSEVAEDLADLGISSATGLTPDGVSREEGMAEAAKYLQLAAEELAIKLSSG